MHFDLKDSQIPFLQLMNAKFQHQKKLINLFCSYYKKSIFFKQRLLNLYSFSKRCYIRIYRKSEKYIHKKWKKAYFAGFIFLVRQLK